MPRLLAVIFALALLSVAPAVATPALGAAQSLPPQMAARIAGAAEQGRLHQAALGDIIDERRQTANRQLETAVVAAINERPDLFQAIMREAHLQAPESRDHPTEHPRGRMSQELKIQVLCFL